MTPPERKPALTKEDLDAIEARWKKSACNRGITDADAVFLRNLRTDAEGVRRMVWKVFLGLVALGMLGLAAYGLLIQAVQLLKKGIA